MNTTDPRQSGRELHPPHAEVPATSRYGPVFWVGVVVGWSGIAFGLWSALSHSGATRPVGLGVYVVGLALVHDMVLAPVTLAAAAGVRRVAPRAARGLVLGALVVSATVTLFAYPFVRGFGEQPDNPSLLPRDAVAGLLLVLSVVWAMAAALMLRRLRHGSR